MKIERVTVAEMTIEAFADKHGLVMTVREQRTRGVRRFTASFKGAEVADRGMLRSAFGSGTTEADAIQDYADEISCERLVIDAMNTVRRWEIDVPRLIGKPPSVGAVDPQGGSTHD